MRRLKKIGFILLIVLVLIQFVRPSLNRSKSELPTDITNSVSVPANIQHIFSVACSDCHSNNTHYPWYAQIQPVGWLLANHIREGKAELNFSEFGSYSKRRQISKLSSIANSVKDGTMPPGSYEWLHKESRLAEKEKLVIIKWANDTKDSIAVSN